MGRGRVIDGRYDAGPSGVLFAGFSTLAKKHRRHQGSRSNITKVRAPHTARP
jgi:hypothetical protein